MFSLWQGYCHARSAFFFGDPSSLNSLQKDRSVDLRKEKWREDGGNLGRALAPPMNLGPHEFFQRRHPRLTESAMFEFLRILASYFRNIPSSIVETNEEK